MKPQPFFLNGGSVLFESLNIYYSKSAPFLPGRRNLLVGRNGSGKSILVRCLSGIIPEVYNAQVTLEAFIGENDSINGKNDLSILSQYTEEILLGFPVCEELNYSINVNPFVHEKRNKLILDFINVKDFLKRSTGELSDGEKQRVSIACALLHSYHWIILDEWHSHLDDNWVATINDLIDRLVENGFLSTVELSSSQINDIEHIHQLETKLIYREKKELIYELKNRKIALNNLLDIVSNFSTRSISGKILYNKNLRRTAALSRLDYFEIPLSTIGIVTGPNGSGKTTLLKAIVAKDNNNKRSKVTLVLSNPILQTLGTSIRELIEKIFYKSNRNEIEFISKQISILIGVPTETDLLDLNAAARKLLAILLACFSPNPFIAIDEPFDGLDPDSTSIAIDILNCALIIRQCCIVISSPVKFNNALFNSPTINIMLADC